jgi:hypothetical protein
MKKIIIQLMFLLILPSINFSQSSKLKWGLSAPIMVAKGPKELALSRTLNDKYMLLFWGKLYWDKNTDSSPNQHLYKNILLGIETELRRNIYQNKIITPYLGIVAILNYENRFTKYNYFYDEPNEFDEEILNSKQIGMGFSFGAEYFITPAISLFIHSRFLYIYYSWNHDKMEYGQSRWNSEDSDEKYTSFNAVGFEGATLYVRFYF